MRDSSQFWSNLADKYSKKPVPNQDNYERKLRLTRELLTQDMKVLEIGCGTGTTALIHAPYVKNIIATDFSMRMIEIAKSKAHDQKISNVDFRKQSVEELNYQEAEFDIVMAHSIIHLIHDKENCIRKIHQSLKPGGYFITSTSCIGGVLKVFMPLWYVGYKMGKIPYINFFTKRNFIDLLTRQGFKIETRWDPSSTDLFLIGKKL